MQSYVQDPLTVNPMTRFILSRPIGVLTITVVLIGLGIWLAGQLPVSILPDFSVPEQVVEFHVPDQDAYDIEMNILNSVRPELAQVPGLVDIESYAVNERGTVQLRYQWGTDMKYAFIQLNEQIDRLRHLLPPGTDRPQVYRIGAAETPMIKLAIADSSQSLTDLTNFSNSTIKRRLEQIQGVARCQVLGGREEIIQITPNTTRMREAGVTISDIESAITSANQQLGSAKIKDGPYVFDLELSSTLKTEADLDKLYITVGEDRLAPLGSFVTSSMATRNTGSHSLWNGEEVLLLEIFRRPDANILETAGQVQEVLFLLSQQFPAVQFVTVDDQSTFVQATVQNLQSSVAYGICGAIILLFFFLGSFRAPFIMAVCVPVSLCFTFLAFYLVGLSINLMTLAGLAIGVGILVDNGIIVVENIERLFRQSGSLQSSILKAVKEITLPLFAATCTTLCIFIPLIFAGELIGVFFYDQALAIGIALTCSLVVSLVLLPLLYKLLPPKKNRSAKSSSGNRILLGMNHGYHRLLEFVMRNPALGWGSMATVIAMGLIAFCQLPASVFPEYDTHVKELHIDWEVKTGLEANLAKTEALLAMLPVSADEVLAQPGTVYRKDQRQPLGLNHLILRIESEKMAELQPQINEMINMYFPEASWSWRAAPGLLSGMIPTEEYPVKLLLSTPTESGLIPLATMAALREWLGNRQDVEEYTLPFANEQTGYRLQLNRATVARIGMKEEEIIQTLDQKLGQKMIGTIREYDKQTDIFITPEASGSLTSFMTSTLTGANHIPISQLVSWKEESRYQCLYAGQGGLRQTLLLKPLGHSQELFHDLGIWAAEHQVLLNKEHDAEKSQQLMTRLSVLMLISIVLLYLVMAAQFESFRMPLIVILTIPFGLAGSLLALWFLGASLNLMSGIGMIVVTGIVVNDSILKVSTVHRLRKSGESLEQAILEAGNTRFRPIILTSLTTILAVTPILFSDGLGVALQGPLCLAVIGGIAMGTLASLFFIPLFTRQLLPAK